jgi:hypothetical protein
MAHAIAKVPQGATSLYKTRHLKLLLYDKQQKEDKMTKITLNADKRKMIADIFQNHFEQQPSKAKIDFESAKQNFDSMVDNVHQLANTVVRHHQPQEDLDTIKAMELKYGNSVVFGIKTHVLTSLILLLKLIKEGKNALMKMKFMLVLN